MSLAAKLLNEIRRTVGWRSEDRPGWTKGREELAASASHDLRAPWATVHEAATLLVDGVVGEVNERQHRLLAIILERTEIWLQRVDDLVGIPQWVAAGCPLHLQEESLAEVVRQAVSQVKGLTLVRDSIITIAAASGLPKVMIDRHRIVQAVRTLVAVIVSSSPRRCRVQLSVVQGPDMEVQIEVHRTNAAASSDDEAVAFTQEPKSDGLSAGDTELGMVRAIIEAHGGRLLSPTDAKPSVSYRLTLPRQVGPISN